ncbi:BZ3500_MvSof-1268-A1-R1_Chr3-1g05714 [Microbotryum saponariae]|uniref:Mitochondrial inner membrane protease ATP23 n=1 Tax=Microbotryum saponariae TaxID=289078 RepID=A0A2X0L0J9_9BASI|nr:BZ3500_MvSof-1268-A1-R1_Chr3-1g05714 [Microbotryum saponariae]SDA04904.1 BZ3501_MvSof-1269-A2-R1_Chr3-1g05384 [Microbotryum saponariae]
MASSTPIDPESRSFLATFERWRIAITSLTLPAPGRPSPLRCDASTYASTSASTPSWSDGQIMQPTTTTTTPTSDTTATAAPVSERERKRLVKECKRCKKWTDELARESPIIRFLLMHVALLPPSPSESTPSPSITSSSPSSSSSTSYPIPITCQPCPPTLAGGFCPTLGILLCQNRFMSKAHLQDALAHELIHAYDDRRFDMGKADDWGKDLRKHACTEIRAENLSGDCRFSREFTRRNWTLTKQHQACVRRRATLSVAANPYCKDEQEAQKIVNEVWHSCWPDTRPFDEVSNFRTTSRVGSVGSDPLPFLQTQIY